MRPKVTERLQLLLQGADAGKTLTQLLTKEDISGEEIFEGGDDEEVEDEAESRDDVGDQLDFEETNEGIHDSLEYEAGSDNEIHSGGQTLEKFDNDSSTYEKISEAFEEGEDNVDDEIDPNEEFSEIMERPIVNEGLPSAVGSTTGFPDDTEFMTEVITVAGMSNKGETTPGHDKSKDDNSSVAGDKKAPLDDSHSEPPRASTQEKEDDLEDWSENGLETSDTVPNSDAYHGKIHFIIFFVAICLKTTHFHITLSISQREMVPLMSRYQVGYCHSWLTSENLYPRFPRLGELVELLS